jgi:oxygen-independent coproporphyrinogen-3 oxidase
MRGHPGLYLHIPFCRQRCDFCAFYLEVHRVPAAAAFVDALRSEIRLWGSMKPAGGRPFQSVYFGGGTPTSLEAGQLVEILQEVRRNFPLTEDCEVTVEAHPGTISRQDLARLFEAGVTRISFGAESMQDPELVQVGRPGSVRQTIEAMACAKEAGFTNLNLDVMYGLPGQSLDTWEQTLAQCVALGPTHLSCYALTVEEGTRLSLDVRRRLRPAPDEDLQVAMGKAAEELLAEAGYERYEISNYARPGYVCRHNLLYWTQGEYLGLGPSAQSFLEGERFGNVPNLPAYERTLAADRLPMYERVTLTEEEQLRDAVIFGLRLIRGVPAELFHRHGSRYGHAAAIERLRQERLIEGDDGRVRLTDRGLLLADAIAERLY